MQESTVTPSRVYRARKTHYSIQQLRHPNRDKYALHNRKRVGVHHV